METPFVVIGMHRSGTSLVSRILDKSGIMMGKDLQTDHESKFFIQLNKWIYQNAGADWARPKALEELIDYAPARKQVEEYLRIRIASSSSKKFSGRNLKNGLFAIDGKRSEINLCIVRYTPCNIPHITKFHDAPCHNPPRNMTVIKLK